MNLSPARSCDILEKKKEFVITADLPGLAKAGPGARAVPRIYELWSRRAPTFIWPIRPVCQCRSLNELLVRKLSYGQVTCARSLRELPIRLQSGSRVDQISSMRGTAGARRPRLTLCAHRYRALRQYAHGHGQVTSHDTSEYDDHLIKRGLSV